MQRKSRSLRVPGLLLLAVLLCLAPAPVPALEVIETFDRDWSTPDAATCRGGHGAFVRRVASGPCGDPGSFSWNGAPGAEHGAPACRGTAGCEGDSVAVHRFAEFEADGGPFGTVNRGVLEIMTTRDRQGAATGRLRVDLHIHEDVPVGGAGEHYLILHNLTVTETACDRDCAGITDTAMSHGDGPDRYRWYGVIGGAFGEPADRDSPIRGGSVGFAVEVPNDVSKSGGRPNDLIDVSYLPYSVGGKGEAFPAGWYRIEIEQGADSYRYSVLRFDGAVFAPIVPDDAAQGGTHERRFPAALLAEPLGRALPPGYIGLTVAWFGGAPRAGAHVDWDDLRVDW